MGGPQDHPYFGEMVYFGSKDPGTQAGPEASEEAFCKAVLSDVETLFKRCQTAFEPIFAKWTKQPFPSAWRDGFTLDGLKFRLKATRAVARLLLRRTHGPLLHGTFPQRGSIHVQVDG